MANTNRSDARIRRHVRLRQRVVGTAERPRLSVYRSLKHIYAQIIDDSEGTTLVAASSLEPEIRSALSATGNKDAAKIVGEKIAERAVEKGVKQVVFDRGGNLYHGRVAALADGARSKGLDF